jgi:2-amino-4-hydroxy-6-hydroxymethyldihydropteridine diphosphokinase
MDVPDLVNMATVVYLALGSNLGDRAALIAAAIRGLQDDDLVTDVVASPLYETDAVAEEPQPAYLNAVVRGVTSLSAQALLAGCLAVEARLGRVRPSGVAKAARVIDIDLLLFGDAIIHQPPTLLVPHPALLARPFVTIPLADVAGPGLIHPATGDDLTTAPRSPSVRCFGD